MIRNTLKRLFRWGLMTLSRRTVPVLAGPLKGRRLLRDHADQLSMLFGTYESTFATAFCRRVKGKSVVYDIGANAGYFSLMAAQVCSSERQILAFEPIAEIIDSLNELMQCNDLSQSVRAVNAAVADTDGQLRLYTPASDKSGVLENAIRHSDAVESDYTDVDAVTLDTFVLDQGNPVPQVIKIDVEGAEASVLAGAQRVLQQHRPAILMEVHGCQPATDVWDLTAPLNYDLRVLTERGEVLVPDRDAWLAHFAGSKWVIKHCALEPRTSASAAA